MSSKWSRHFSCWWLLWVFYRAWNTKIIWSWTSDSELRECCVSLSRICTGSSPFLSNHGWWKTVLKRTWSTRCNSYYLKLKKIRTLKFDAQRILKSIQMIGSTRLTPPKWLYSVRFLQHFCLIVFDRFPRMSHPVRFWWETLYNIEVCAEGLYFHFFLRKKEKQKSSSESEVVWFFRKDLQHKLMLM